MSDEVDVAEIEFQGIRTVPTVFWDKTCPFRGHPFKFNLDDRCPRVVVAYLLPVTDKPRGLPATSHSQPFPVLTEDSYCGTCVFTKVREQEAGLVINTAGSNFRHRRRSKKVK